MQADQLSTRPALIVANVLLAALFLGCAAGRSSDTYSTQPAASTGTQASGAPPAATESEFAGVWEGTTLATCATFAHLPSRCNAEQKVTIILVKGPDSKLTGRYTCSYGNMDCYDQNDTGKVIDVSITGVLMNIRVIMPDTTSCMFSGRNVSEDINGGYSCYQGGSLIEQGAWRARRSY
jgi:hypothetical protein